MALTDKRERFVQELIKGKSQREAYKLAGYKTDAMTDNAIDVEASKLFKNPEVSLRYEELRSRLIKEAEDECIVTAKQVLREYAKIGFSNISDYLKVERRMFRGDDGQQQEYKAVDIFETDQIDRDKLDAVAEIKQTKEGIAIKLHDKKGALDSIARHLGMFVDKVESNNTNNNLNQDVGGLSAEERRARIDELNRRRGNGANSAS